MGLTIRSLQALCDHVVNGAAERAIYSTHLYVCHCLDNGALICGVYFIQRDGAVMCACYTFCV
jgi:hypothetical protein